MVPSHTEVGKRMKQNVTESNFLFVTKVSFAVCRHCSVQNKLQGQNNVFRDVITQRTPPTVSDMMLINIKLCCDICVTWNETS